MFFLTYEQILHLGFRRSQGCFRISGGLKGDSKEPQEHFKGSQRIQGTSGGYHKILGAFQGVPGDHVSRGSQSVQGVTKRAQRRLKESQVLLRWSQECFWGSQGHFRGSQGSYRERQERFKGSQGVPGNFHRVSEAFHGTLEGGEVLPRDLRGISSSTMRSQWRSRESQGRFRSSQRRFRKFQGVSRDLRDVLRGTDGVLGGYQEISGVFKEGSRRFKGIVEFARSA